ncbi:membrane protein insertase YidC [Pleionea sediminis]|uniref:membrane protein insertase YidC n=1 Tax=Pleionea sediminis TaxID=2569479 RepID=UPI001186CAF1|nr:membrane protein insertase YidC [Pleionea sediminis]
MESSRGILLLALAFITFLLYQQWQTDFPPKQLPSQEVSQQEIDNSGIPDIEPNGGITETSQSVDASDIPEVKHGQKSPQSSTKGELIKIANDVLEIQVDTHGGDVVFAKLLKFNKKLKDESDKVTLLTKENGRTFFAKSALLGEDSPDQKSFRAVYKVKEIADTDSGTQLTLLWTNESGVEFSKIFTLNNGAYDIDVRYVVNNTSQNKLYFKMMNELIRDQYVSNSESSGFGIQAYTGAAFSNDESNYVKHDFDDMVDSPVSEKATGGWIAFLQHYFVAAWVPEQTKVNEIRTFIKSGTNLAVVRVLQDWVKVGPGEKAEISGKLFVGPKDQDDLAQLAEGLDLTVDYWIFWWIGQPIFWLLTMFHGLVGNWGVSIILVTIFVKVLLYPLASAQYRSFAKMRMLAPKLQQLKERYGEDRQKMSMAMMELYKKEKVNPMGGCLPLLIQMPVFLALYWVLLESYEIRHAPFMLWITDLSAKDPFYILPILMGASMWAMQKLQPTAATMDPMQQKIMQFLPLMMTVFFMFFPAGLVLYWLVNNLLSIAQQLYITNKIEKEYATKKKV